MKRVTFEEAYERASRIRKSPLWKSLQSDLPPLKRSDHSALPDVSLGDLLERIYVQLEEDQWQTITGFKLMSAVASTDGPIVTGDPTIDKLEAEFWERSRGSNG